MPKTLDLIFQPSHSRYAEQFMSWRQDPDTIRYNPLAATDLEAIRKRLSSSSKPDISRRAY